ncbi:hypothetical protein HA402_001801 [Bradysia odoriphaga]|nr:hypothetical protein HA402_001801 [Bradysia odoriphaga]
MVQHLNDWNETQLVDNLERWKRDTKDLDDGIMELLEAAIVKNLPESVAILMDLCPDINGISKNGKFKMTPGFLSCTFGHYQVLKILLSNQNLSFQSTSLQSNLLHQIFSHEAVDPVDRQKTFDLIIADRRCTLDLINQPDSENRVPLLFACLFECDDIVKELLRRGTYIGYESVLNYIKKDTLEELLDECVKCSGDIRGRDCEIYIDYKFLMPPDRKKTEIASVHLICASSKLKELILHPVIASFVLLKWRRIDYIVYFNLLVYFGFIIFLGYIIMTFHYVLSYDMVVSKRCQLKAENHDSMFTEELSKYDFGLHWTDEDDSYFALLLFTNIHLIQSTYTDYSVEKLREWKENDYTEREIRQILLEESMSYWFGIFGLTLMAAYEVVQCAMSYKKHFFKPTNWLDILLIFFSFLALIGVVLDENIFRLLCVIMILLMGAQSIQLFSKVSTLSLSLHMAILNRVFQTFLKTIAPYLFILLAFGTCFFAWNHEHRRTAWLKFWDRVYDPDDVHIDHFHR